MWQGWNLHEWTNQHDVARVDIAGVDNAAPLWQGWTMREWSEVTKQHTKQLASQMIHFTYSLT